MRKTVTLGVLKMLIFSILTLDSPLVTKISLKRVTRCRHILDFSAFTFSMNFPLLSETSIQNISNMITIIMSLLLSPSSSSFEQTFKKKEKKMGTGKMKSNKNCSNILREEHFPISQSTKAILFFSFPLPPFPSKTISSLLCALLPFLEASSSISPGLDDGRFGFHFEKGFLVMLHLNFPSFLLHGCVKTLLELEAAGKLKPPSTLFQVVKNYQIDMMHV